jgi:hypothetical protein
VKRNDDYGGDHNNNFSSEAARDLSTFWALASLLFTTTKDGGGTPGEMREAARNS